eukprot:gnl/TRDRNA2_/TRDRNA2_82259_c0_seq1.p1 gnl/TRDRNA2_/TRDRNA2_82259_c0~~gnl/TRDRNA2_/TRDRNA2_82259_c0_seq1.p1  ORF type:complete len:212 (+),score=4.10 gnl/TRDRNA2_/TRDRNA2_82259_c0_seq1:62-637(+)
MGLLDVLPWICGLVALVGAGVYGGSPYPTGAIVFYGLTLVLFALGWFFDAVVPVVCGYFASFTYYLVVQLMHVPADLLDFKKYSMLVPAAMGLWNLIGYKVGVIFLANNPSKQRQGGTAIRTSGGSMADRNGVGPIGEYSVWPRLWIRPALPGVQVCIVFAGHHNALFFHGVWADAWFSESDLPGNVGTRT